jgi:hypothetical protein
MILTGVAGANMVGHVWWLSSFYYSPSANLNQRIAMKKMCIPKKFRVIALGSR